MMISVKLKPVDYKLDSDSQVFLCSHVEAYLKRVEAFNPDDGEVLVAHCDLTDCTGFTDEQANNIYERLS